MLADLLRRGSSQCSRRLVRSLHRLGDSERVRAELRRLEESEKLRKDRYDAIQKEEARVLREQPVAAPAKGAEPAVEPIEVPPAEPGAADAFSTREDKPAA